MCESVGVDLIFHPEAEEMYEKDFCSFVDMTGLTEGLCGKTRPIHFRGVCTVVNKLFNIVTPDHAYFGQKDGQQLAVIKRMVRDLNMDIESLDVRSFVKKTDLQRVQEIHIFLLKKEKQH